MAYIQLIGPILTVWAVLHSLVKADCPDLPECDALGPPPIGANCGIDPKDPNALGVYALICPCYVGEVLDCTVTYTDINGATSAETTSTTVTFSSSESVFTYSFTEPATSIQSGSPISIQFGARGGLYPVISQIYSPVTSIYYVDATTTTTSTETDTTTSTSTLDVTLTSVIPQQTSTTDCTTGTLTVTAPTSTTTLTSTITPAPKTSTKFTTVKTTTRASCVSSSPKARRAIQERRDDYMLLDARQAPFVAETLWCPADYGSPQSTYITTGTVTESDSTTTTSTVVVTTVETDTETDSPTPLTTTVCNNVAATTTTTPKTTLTISTTRKGSTILTTRTVTKTITTYPHYPPPLCRCPTSYHHHSPTGHALTLKKS